MIASVARELSVAVGTAGVILKDMYEDGLLARDQENKQIPMVYRFRRVMRAGKIESDMPKTEPEAPGQTEEPKTFSGLAMVPTVTLADALDQLRKVLGKPFSLLYLEGDYPVVINSEAKAKVKLS